jgi:hypothetical protein
VRERCERRVVGVLRAARDLRGKTERRGEEEDDERGSVKKWRVSFFSTPPRKNAGALQNFAAQPWEQQLLGREQLTYIALIIFLY